MNNTHNPHDFDHNPETPREAWDLIGKTVTRTLRNHKIAVTIVAATLIFVTYCVKDIWKESVDKEVASIDAATNQLLIEQGFEDVDFSLTEIKSALGTQALKNPTPGQLREEKIKLYFSTSIGAVQESDPHASKFLASAPAVEKRSREERNVLEKEIRENAVKMFEIFHQGVPPSRETELKNAFAAIRVLTDRRNQLLVKTGTEVKEEKEHSYEVLSIVSYCLFLLSWAIGLTAQLGGVK